MVKFILQVVISFLRWNLFLITFIFFQSCVPFGGQSDRDQCLNGDIASSGVKSNTEIACSAYFAVKKGDTNSDSALTLCLVMLKQLDKCKSKGRVRYPYMPAPQVFQKANSSKTSVSQGCMLLYFITVSFSDFRISVCDTV